MEVVVLLSSGYQNTTQYLLNITIHLMVREPNRPNTSSSHPALTSRVERLLGRVAVGITVNFYYESHTRTVKVHDVVPDTLLPPEFVSSEPALAEVSPQNNLSLCCVVAEFLPSFLILE